MNLLELCEPLFQAVCRLNRSARKGLSPDYHQVRSEITSIFADTKARSRSTPGLGEQYDKIEYALYFFVDSMMSESQLTFARMWNDQRLAEELHPPQLGGDEAFFDLLDETLKDKSAGAAERLQVYATCLGLGFTGFYAGQPEYLRRKMNEIQARVHNLGDGGPSSRICPETYEHVNTADLVEPPGAKLVGFGIALVGLLIVVGVANVWSFNYAKGDLDKALKNFTEPNTAQTAREEGAS